MLLKFDENVTRVVLVKGDKNDPFSVVLVFLTKPFVLFVTFSENRRSAVRTRTEDVIYSHAGFLMGVTTAFVWR